MTQGISIEIDSRSLEAEARKAQKALKQLGERAVVVEVRALNATAKRVESRVRKGLAKAKGVQQKVLKGRVQRFKASRRARFARVWVGLKSGIKLSNLPGAQYVAFGKHRGTLKAGRARVSSVFPATMPNGRKGLYVRKPGSRHRKRPDGQYTELPIEEPQIRLQPEAGELLQKHGREQMRTYYPAELKRLINVEAQRAAARAK